MSQLNAASRVIADVVDYSLQTHFGRGYSAMFLKNAAIDIHLAKELVTELAASTVRTVTVRKNQWIDTYFTFTNNVSGREAKVTVQHHIGQNNTVVVIDKSADINYTGLLAQVLGYIVKVEGTLDVTGEPIAVETFGHSALEAEGTNWDSSKNATGGLRAGTAN